MDDDQDFLRRFSEASGAHGMAAMGVLRILIRALQRDLLLSPEGVAGIFALAEQQALESDAPMVAEIVRAAGVDVLTEAPIRGA